MEEFLRYERLPEGYVPGIVQDSSFVPKNVLEAGTVAGDVRLEFVETFNNARSMALPPQDETSTETNGDHANDGTMTKEDADTSDAKSFGGTAFVLAAAAASAVSMLA